MPDCRPGDHPPVSPATTTQPPLSTVVKAEPSDTCCSLVQPGIQRATQETNMHDPQSALALDISLIADVLAESSGRTSEKLEPPEVCKPPNGLPDDDELIVTHVVIKRQRLRGKTGPLPNPCETSASDMVFVVTSWPIKEWGVARTCIGNMFLKHQRQGNCNCSAAI